MEGWNDGLLDGDGVASVGANDGVFDGEFVGKGVSLSFLLRTVEMRQSIKIQNKRLMVFMIRTLDFDFR